MVGALVGLVKDKSVASLDQSFALVALKEMGALGELSHLALDPTLPIAVRSTAIVEIGMSGNQAVLQTLAERLETEALRQQAGAFLQTTK